MQVTKPGKIQDGLWMFGRYRSCVHIMKNKNGYILINGGMSYILKDVLRQMEEFGIDKRKINSAIILHTHFDHIGIIPYFKQINPDLIVYASLHAKNILKKPKVIESINAFSRMAAERMTDQEMRFKEDSVDWSNEIEIEVVVKNDIIEADQATLQVYETPGHSLCSISVYSPEYKALFPSDAGGVLNEKAYTAYGNSNYTLFQQSLEKLKELDVKYLCSDHYGYVKGKKAGVFINEVIELAKKRRFLMEEIYLKTRNLDMAVKEATETFSDENTDSIVSSDVFEETYRQMMAHIASELD